MDYARPPLFPKHKGAVQLPVVIREISDPSLEVYYLVSVHPGKLHAEGFDPNFITIKKCVWTVLTCQFRLDYVTDLNQISHVALKQFVFIDDGSFYNVNFNKDTLLRNSRRVDNLNDRPLFNLSNVFSPLRMYRLTRTYESNLETDKNTRTCKTTWEMEIIDHSEYTPCSRTGAEWVVVGKKKCLYLLGGTTILADTDFQGSLDEIDDNWFYYPVNDVWRYDFPTKSWMKILDLVTHFDGSSTSVESFVELRPDRKFPPFLYNISLIWDYANNRIYGCYLDEKITGLRTTVFSIEPSQSKISTHRVLNQRSRVAMFISYDYNRLVLQFGKKEYVFKIRQDTLFNRAMHLSNLLYNKSFNNGYLPVRFYNTASFLVSVDFAKPSEIESTRCVFGLNKYIKYDPFNLRGDYIPAKKSSPSKTKTEFEVEGTVEEVVPKTKQKKRA